VALRILPGVDVLEQRWAAAEKIFEENGIEAVDYFTGADPTEIKKIISDELATGDVQGVWMDAGDGAVAAIEAFEDAGKDYPVMTGEDEMSFLRKWEETGLTGLAPVYSNFQWRTPLLALEKIFAGEEIPSEWVLPQTPIPKRTAPRSSKPTRECLMATTPSSAARTSRLPRRVAGTHHPVSTGPAGRQGTCAA
jgi:ribose transport system substrate-binding protein